MNHGDFIWADLSTYSTQDSLQFYKEVFGWEILNLEKYYLANIGDVSIAGIFETPDFLKKLRMPHFWMSYFKVNSVKETIEIAKNLNGIIEVGTTSFNKGQIALIRDPQGAGFTIYEGDSLYFNDKKPAGSIVKTELHVSNLQNVLAFYSRLFDWKFKELLPNILEVTNQNIKSYIQIKEIDNTVKGKYEYWATTIMVDDLKESTQLVKDNNGYQVMSEEGRNLMTDNSREAFFYIEALKV